ncbi:MAG TPA: (2Fe-2S)-binding protein [Acidimicrobiales bacterium]|nr:(2Fe-2S)-binding protein [Acidimicrobiales bacterium]
MYVCHCRGVTDKDVRGAIESGATDLAELARRCAAGSGCGGCCPALQTLLAEYGLSAAVSAA